MVSKVLGTWFRAWGTQFRENGVHGFGGTGVQGLGYIVSHYPHNYSSIELMAKLTAR